MGLDCRPRRRLSDRRAHRSRQRRLRDGRHRLRRRHHDDHSGRRRSGQRVPGSVLGTVHLLGPSGGALHRRRVFGVRQSSADRGVADALSRRGACRLRHRENLPGLHHEGRVALDVDRLFRPHHAAARRDHPRALARLLALDAWNLPRRGPRLRGSGLDWTWPRPSQRRCLITKAGVLARPRELLPSVGGHFPRGSPLRWIYLAIVVVVAAATLIFALQNLQIVSVAFLGLAIAAPLALMIFIVYILGALTGGSLYALLRRSVQGSRRTSA